MDKQKNTPANDPAAQNALKEEANKPDPLYDKTNRNFQQSDQGDQSGKSNDANEDESERGSSSGEEKDITV